MAALISERMIEPTAKGSNCRHCAASKRQNSAVKIALSPADGNSTGGEPTIKLPMAHEAAMIGAIVHGLLSRLPVTNAALFSRQTTETSAARIVCNPNRGENPINVPMANASAVRSGDSSKLSKVRKARRNMTNYFSANKLNSLMHGLAAALVMRNRTLRVVTGWPRNNR